LFVCSGVFPVSDTSVSVLPMRPDVLFIVEGYVFQRKRCSDRLGWQ
jgi:hypothetical protein